jgi:hypothetical protein
MAPAKRLDAPRASADSSIAESDSYDLLDLDDELKRLSAATQELLGEFRPPASSEPESDLEVELELYRMENDELRARIAELEANASGKGDANWQERQKEYESLLEEKSEVIRNLHLQIQELEESVDLGGSAPVCPSSGNVSGSRLGQAAEIMRLKRDLEEQRLQLKQDEQDMIAQMREMELTMARERAEMARQRQELQRMKTDLAREVEQTSRDPELRERLNTLSRRTSPNLTAPVEKQAPKPEPPQKTSGFFKRIFGK